MDGGTIGGCYGYRNGQRSWLICYRYKTRKILLSAAIFARFCCLVASLKALVLPLLYIWTAVLLADVMAIETASEVGSLVIVIKLENY
jgi:hypothetical protein